MAFNHESRKKNVIRASASALVNAAVSIGLQLVYRMVFLRVLTYEYLGIDRLFADILGLMGLAELGVTEAIIFRLYDPISREDTRRVGELMRFFKRAYHLVALVILVLGSAICPFLGHFIRDAGEIPNGANIQLIFMLLLIQTASTYLFSYRFSLLNADQRQDRTNRFNTLNALVRYSVQLLILVATHNYTVTLAAGIVVTLLCNWLEGRWIEGQYPQVFQCKSALSRQERGRIYRDTSAAFLHKIGGTVVTSTDSILLSRFIGLAVTGIYSNYQMVIAGISAIIGALLGGLMPTLGNVHATMKEAERYDIYRKMLFLNFWVAGIAGCCLYNLIDDFILLWIRRDLYLDGLTVLLLCVLFYMQTARQVSTIYTMSCGLLTRDRLRPLIESALNIVISILCLRWIGTAGIFVGTIVSNLATVFWREPYLLYRYAFGQKLGGYWKTYILNLAVTAGAVWISSRLKAMLFGAHVSIAAWLASAVLCALVFLVIHGLVFFRSDEYHYFAGLLRRWIHRTDG